MRRSTIKAYQAYQSLDVTLLQSLSATTETTVLATIVEPACLAVQSPNCLDLSTGERHGETLHMLPVVISNYALEVC